MTRIDEGKDQIASINVYVTGFGPYPTPEGRIDPNTSWVLVSQLPKTLSPNTPDNPLSARINIIRPSKYVKTEYQDIRQFCRSLHRDHARDVDLFIHLGEARGWDWITIERLAFKQGMSSSWWSKLERKAYYMIPDDKGETVEDAGPNPWDEVPIGLQGALDVDAVVDGAKTILKMCDQFGDCGGASRTLDQEHFPKATAGMKALDIRPHLEGGAFGCGFIYYESLANCYVNGQERNVLFCHMPAADDQATLSRVRDGILAIIVSGVNQVLLNRARH